MTHRGSRSDRGSSRQPDLTLADAYATTVFVMGLDGLDWLARHPDYDAYAITHDDMAYWTDGFARYRT